MAFETRIKVRFSDVDRAGIAYYPRVVHWLHVAFEEFWEGFVGVPYATVLERENLGFPAVGLSIEFEKPMRFGEVLTVRVGLERIGRSSVAFRYDVLGADGGRRASARVTVVCVRLDTLVPTALPDRYRTIFERALVPPRAAD
jgi:YbgC/YbaW family acyl-CoA thioester hydrolase